ncbi:hypothetical protein ACQ4M4_27320 [Leptolyngbya sp. AN02str]|uniref:hypothetical protein n=1 Tax=Leptolyngbya sp. AN02str TaxID=3423363 RepID=UPI003D31D04D
MNTSLTKFCKDNGLPKSSVYNRCQELGISTANGLNDAAIAQLRVEFDLDAPTPSPQVEAELMPDNFIQPGQLAAVQAHDVQMPQGFDPTAMVRFFDGVTGQATDTSKLVAIADLALNAVSTAMDNKISEQRQQLEQSKQHAKQLETKVAEAKTALQVKALESRILAAQQTETTKTAEEIFAELMALGKPSPSEPSSEQS